jgi:hypothetical protein
MPKPLSFPLSADTDESDATKHSHTTITPLAPLTRASTPRSVAVLWIPAGDDRSGARATRLGT